MESTPTITIDFAGWKTFFIEKDAFNVVNPWPTVSDIAVSKTAGTDTTVYISEISAAIPVYDITVPEGINVNDASIYKKITSSYKEYLMGKALGTSSEHQAKLNTVNNECKATWKSLKNTKSESGKNEIHTLFGMSAKAIDVTDGREYEANGASVLPIYEEIKKLAYGYGLQGSDYYHNSELLADIVYALDYCYEYYYGKEIVETGATHGNWWEWDVGIPFALTEILCIIEDDVEIAEIQRYLKPFDIINLFPAGSGANLIDIAQSVILSSAFNRDYYRICQAKELLYPLFAYADEASDLVNDGGFFRDGSYVQHNYVPYAGLYGQQLINHLAAVLYFTSDSPFAFVGDIYNAPYDWIFDSFRPFIFEDSFMSAVRGRSISYYSEKYAFIETVTGFIKIAYSAPSSHKSELEAMIRSLMLNCDVDFTQYVPIALIDYCVSIRDNQNLTLTKPYINMQVFGNMDRAVQHREKYSVAISLNSTRMSRYESINTNNEAGWYHSDGMIYIYTKGYDFSAEMFSFANQYLMPGVTSNSAKRIQTCIHPMMFNANPYAGGVSQGLYGTMGYALDYNGTNLQGTFVNASEAKLSAYKSYFMFDNEIICIGTNIQDSSGCDVFTTVENRQWKDGDTLYIENELTAPTDIETETEARTLWFSGMGGYVFLRPLDKDQEDGNCVYVRKTVGQTNDTIAFEGYNKPTPSFLEIIMEHRPTEDDTVTKGRYYYAYLPSATREETANYNDVELLAYNTDTHAVIEKKLGIVACNFFEDVNREVLNPHTEASAVTKIKTGKACSVMVTKNADGSYTISVSDPTQLKAALSLSVTIIGITQVVSADNGVTATVSGGAANITVICANAHGKTFNLTVK